MKPQPENHVSVIGFFASLSILIILGVVVAIAVRLQTPLGLVTTTAELGLTATAGNGTEFPVDSPEFRQTYEAAEFQTREALIQTITPEAPPTGRPPTDTPAPFIPGIYDTPYALFGAPQAYATSNRWQDIVNGERTYVYAGARNDTSGATPDITQGLVVVQVYSTDLSNESIVEYEAPGATGMLTITAATGFRLVLTSQSGTTLYFDVPTRQFVDGLTATVTAPTATPLPPITPTAIAPTGYPPPSGYPQPSPSAPAPTAQTQIAP